MGTGKANLVVGGEALAARAARVLAAVCAPVVEVGPGASGLPSVREQPPGSGPLAALVAGAETVAVDAPVLLLACDLPFVTPAILRLLAEWPDTDNVVPVAGGRLQYVCARYAPGALEEAKRSLRRGRRALADLVARTGYVQVDESCWRAHGPPHAFADLDTPEDLRRFGLS
jgi:molybdopterin-guanine dinucleotide biosynthesis protein A